MDISDTTTADELNSKINTICIRERRPTTVTFNNTNYGVAETDVSKSGYTPLGITGFQSAGNTVLYRASAVSFKINSNTTIAMTVVNQSGVAETSTQTGWIDVLYIRNMS